METMRASSETRGIIPVVVVELGVVDAEVLSAWRDDTMWAGIVESLLSVFSTANDHTSDDLGIAINDILSE